MLVHFPPAMREGRKLRGKYDEIRCDPAVDNDADVWPKCGEGNQMRPRKFFHWLRVVACEGDVEADSIFDTVAQVSVISDPVYSAMGSPEIHPVDAVATAANHGVNLKLLGALNGNIGSQLMLIMFRRQYQARIAGEGAD